MNRSCIIPSCPDKGRIGNATLSVGANEKPLTSDFPGAGKIAGERLFVGADRKGRISDATLVRA